MDVTAIKKRAARPADGTFPGHLAVATEDFCALCDEIERLQRLLRCCVGCITRGGPLPSPEEVKEIIQAAKAAGDNPI